MQVVYSGGSSTPTPSPHLQRKNHPGHSTGYGRPIMPGYIMGHHQPAIYSGMSGGGGGGGCGAGGGGGGGFHRPSREKLTEGDASLKDSIPAMSKPVAVICLVLNIVLPGLGTFVSGLTVLCGSQVRPKGASRGSVVWANSGVALLQFLLTFLCLLGWIWSIMWGTTFLSVSKEYYKKPQVEEVSTHGRAPKPSPDPKRNAAQSDADHNNVSSPATSASNSSGPRPRHSPNADLRHHHHHHSQLQIHQQQQQQQRNGLSVTSMGGIHHRRSAPEIYLTPSSMSPSGLEPRVQPIIVLQEAPVSVNRAETPPAPTRALMNARTRHEKILQRQMSDLELSPFILTHQQLEAIVIHDAPVLTRPSRSRPLGVGEADPEYQPLPKT